MNELPVIKADGRVLSTLESDGSRRWLHPRLSTGRYWRRRRIVAYALIALYALLPWIQINGRPALQLDLWNGRFYILGGVYLPTDMRLLAVLGLLLFLGILFATAIFGRVWCGWACPQTVYLEYVYRPLERLATGVRGRGGKPRKAVAAWRIALMYAAFLLVSWHLANTFLAYFVGARELHNWIWRSSPLQHPAALALVLSMTGLMLFDFCYWREQLCIIGCPYGRFQSVMLDRSSLIVGYDHDRGEPRGKGRNRDAKGLGSCVDCQLCVDVCPTGIDIRDGLQLECVNCTQCIDACDAVMDRTGQPRGLIRYSSQEGLEGKPTKIARPRVIIYAVVLLALAGYFATLLATRTPFAITLLRGMGRPFSVLPTGEVENVVRMKIVNRTDAQQTYRVTALAPASLSIAGEAVITLPPRGVTTEPLHLVAPATAYSDTTGTLTAILEVADSAGTILRPEYRLFGPAPDFEAPR